MLPLDIETMSSLTHLLAAFNMIAELPENLYQLKSLQTLDVYENQISNVPNHLMEMNLKRFDLSQNDLTKSAFKDQTNQEVLESYWVMQENLRSWDGVLPENQKENYELNRSLFYDRKEFKTELAVERPSYRKSCNDLINDNLEEENEDFHGNRDEDYMEHEVNDEEVPPEHQQVPNPDMEEWTNQ